MLLNRNLFNCLFVKLILGNFTTVQVGFVHWSCYQNCEEGIVWIPCGSRVSRNSLLINLQIERPPEDGRQED